MRKDIALILLILAILALIIVPLGPAVLDVLLSINLSLAVLLLIVAVYLKHPADFSTFPTVILLGTAFRLALSIATTRQILSEAEAGQIIETFGTFVIGGNIAIGLIVFLIITVFQFLVVTKGAERVAEVSARFALDALPGKQMSIDADLRAENIDKATASERRARLERESQFFGSMDGAMKFVKGDAIAGLIIIFINLIGGISVGMLVLGFTFEDAIATYTLLTLGDGLVAQLPALLMALCAGIVTTRIDGEENVDLGSDIWRDLVTDPRVPAAASGIVLLIGLIPGFPLLNFAVAASILLIVSFSVRKVLLEEQSQELLALAAGPAGAVAARQGGADDATGGEPGLRGPENAKPQAPRSNRLTLRLGAALAEELDGTELNDKLDVLFDRYERTRGLRFAPPSIEIDPDETRARVFEVELDEVPLLTETVPEDSMLLACDEKVLAGIGIEAAQIKPMRWREMTGYWVPEALRETVQRAQLTPLQAEQHIATMAFRIAESNVGTLFSNQQFDAFLTSLAQSNPRQREELEQKVDRAVLFQTLRYLAEDGVPLRPVGLIVDAFLSWLQNEGNVGALALSEYMRGSLKRQICHALSAGRGTIGVILLDPMIESAARAAIAATTKQDSAAATDGLPFNVENSEMILGQFRQLAAQLSQDDPIPVVIASSTIRRRMRNYLSANRVSLPVLAPHELSPEINVHPVARIALPLGQGQR